MGARGVSPWCTPVVWCVNRARRRCTLPAWQRCGPTAAVRQTCASSVLRQRCRGELLRPTCFLLAADITLRKHAPRLPAADPADAALPGLELAAPRRPAAVVTLHTPQCSWPCSASGAHACRRLDCVAFCYLEALAARPSARSRKQALQWRALALTAVAEMAGGEELLLAWGGRGAALLARTAALLLVRRAGRLLLPARESILPATLSAVPTCRQLEGVHEQSMQLLAPSPPLLETGCGASSSVHTAQRAVGSRPYDKPWPRPSCWPAPMQAEPLPEMPLATRLCLIKDALDCSPGLRPALAACRPLLHELAHCAAEPQVLHRSAGSPMLPSVSGQGRVRPEGGYCTAPGLAQPACCPAPCRPPPRCKKSCKRWWLS